MKLKELFGFFVEQGIEKDPRGKKAVIELLKEAKESPEKYPWLIVRVSGYSAYFNDLSPAMKDEIIQRSSLSC